MNSSSHTWSPIRGLVAWQINCRATLVIFLYRLGVAGRLFFLMLSFSFPLQVQGQCDTLFCQQNITVALDANCQGAATPEELVQNFWDCPGTYTLEYFDAASQSLGAAVNGEYLGQLLDVQVTHESTGHSCWATVLVSDPQPPAISFENMTLGCLATNWSVAALGQPAITDNCTGNFALSYQDIVLEFGCGDTGFDGYFAPQNWSIQTDNGDGGVDVTGAPDSVLVEGAGNSAISENPLYVTAFQVVIPSDGYLSFDWIGFGGSTFYSEAFYLTINSVTTQLSSDSIASGSYATPPLNPGDVVTFLVTSDGDTNALRVLLTHFRFHILAWKVVQRQWTATDVAGNATTATQTISLRRTQLSQIIFPKNLDETQGTMLGCFDEASTSVTGVPLVDDDGDLTTTADQYPVSAAGCFLLQHYQDEILPACGGSTIILRKWSVMDGCTNEVRQDTQVIMRMDETAPQIGCPLSLTINAGQQPGCFSSVILPNAIAYDACSPYLAITPSWAFGAGFGPFNNVQQGTYPVTYTATDACGNSASCATTVTVKDTQPPIAKCKNLPVLPLSAAGNAVVQAEMLDNGSFDFCCLQSFKVKRLWQPIGAFANSLILNCGDAGSTIMLQLKVSDCYGNFSTCQAQVQVLDNMAPSITPPPDIFADCTDDLSNLSQFGEAEVSDNCTMTLTETLTENLNACGQGYVVRHFTATDAGGNTATAQQTIQVLNLSPWNAAGNQIAWPLDFTTSACATSLTPAQLPAAYAVPVLNGQNACSNLSATHYDVTSGTVASGCYTVTRTWKVKDQCQVAAANGGIWQHVQTLQVTDIQSPVFMNFPTVLNVPLPATGCTATVDLPAANFQDCNDVAVQVSGALGNGTHFPNVQAGTYQMTYTLTDECQNQSQQTLTVHVADTQAPEAHCVPSLTVSLDAGGQATVNVQAVNAGSADNCTAAASLQFSFLQNMQQASQVFSCANGGGNSLTLWVKDQAGNVASCQTMVTISETQPPVAHCVPTISIALDVGGTASVGVQAVNAGSSDNCTAASNLQFSFSQNTTQASQAFSCANVGSNPLTLWIKDQAGNAASCQTVVTLAENQPPAAHCAPALTLSLNADGEAGLPAQSLNDGSTDNCTVAGNLQFSFSQNTAQPLLTFDCEDAGTVSVTVWVMDGAGNAASCQTQLTIAENPQACDPLPTGLTIAGHLQKPNGDAIGLVTIHLAGAGSTPVSTLPDVGDFTFANLPELLDYTLVPDKNLGPLNGVSTLDLVRISDHILGNVPFTQTWQYIAGDANNSGAVATSDLVAIQNLILMNTSEFPNGTPSWRFVPASYVFPNPTDPFPFPQSISLNNLAADFLTAHFTGIKTGDVTGNADPDLFGPTDVADERSAQVLPFTAAEQLLTPGETVQVTLTPGQASAWQFTLAFDTQALAFLSVENEGAAEKPLFGLGLQQEGKLAALGYGESATRPFTLIFKALKKGKLSEVLEFNSKMTPAAAWDEMENLLSPQLVFLPQENVEMDRLVLLQNQPNPFSGETMLRFRLPEAGRVQFSFFDAAGKKLFATDGDFTEGWQQLTVQRQDLPGAGLIFYQIETAAGCRTGRMAVQ